VVKLLDGYDQEVKAIREELLRMCWFMRGSISYTEATMLSNSDRETISKIIKENLETAKESKMPFW
jgi:hypothetical protein